MKRVTSILFCLLFVANASYAAGGKVLSTKNDTKKICDEFMQRVVEGEITGAFELVEPYFPLPDAEFDMLKMQSVKQLGLVSSRFGNEISFELIKDQSIRDIFSQYIYLEKFEKHAVRWTFTFYNPRNGWIVNNLRWDDNINDLFE